MSDPTTLRELVTNWRDAAVWEHTDMHNTQYARALDQCADELEKELATLGDAAAPCPQWHPIASAPKDRPVVVWNGEPYRGYYEDAEGWFADIDGEMLRIDPPPTLWIPAPPAGDPAP